MFQTFHEIHLLTTAFRKETKTSTFTLSQKFVLLLLNSEHGVVKLEHAGEILCGYKDRKDYRRLYDIASVLCSLNLVSQHTILVLFISFNYLPLSDQKSGSRNF
jgi:hypothetical protein